MKSKHHSSADNVGPVGISQVWRSAVWLDHGTERNKRFVLILRLLLRTSAFKQQRSVLPP